MKVKEDDWDFVIIGDGSGSSWGHEIGWASVSIEKATGERKVWNGSANSGTVNFAEIMAYLQPLNWLASREADKRNKQIGDLTRRAYRIHIFTDSEYCKNTGKSRGQSMTKNGSLWAAFNVFVRQGFVLYWHWVRRDTVGLNAYSDELSKLARKLTKKYNLQERMERDTGRTVDEINPTDCEGTE